MECRGHDEGLRIGSVVREGLRWKGERWGSEGESAAPHGAPQGGRTPLHTAVEFGRAEAVAALVAAGADLNVQDVSEK